MYVVSVWLHIVAAAAWIGSMIFFAAVVVPVLRDREVQRSAPSLLRRVGARFRVFGWVAIAVLVVTGLGNLHFRGIAWSTLSEGAFWSSGFGRALGYKLALVAAVVAATASHDALVGRRAIRELEDAPDSPRARRTRAIASWLGRLVLLASLAVLYFATTLVRGL